MIFNRKMNFNEKIKELKEGIAKNKETIIDEYDNAMNEKFDKMIASLKSDANNICNSIKQMLKGEKEC